MFRSNAFRLLLLLLLLAGISAIIWSYRSRSGNTRPATVAQLLSEEISRKSTEFEHTQMREGSPVFQVLASISTITRAGVHELEDVTMFRYDPEGNPTDAIKGRGALYRIDDKEIEFEEDVVIHLYDGTTVYADWAGANLDSEVIRINGAFRFDKEEIRGEGGRLSYDIPTQTMTISQGLDLEFGKGSQAGEAHSRSAIYAIHQGRIELKGAAEIGNRQYWLKSTEAILRLAEDRSAQEIKARGAARLTLQAGRTFSGEQINLELETRVSPERSLEVLGGQASATNPATRAVYESGGAGGGFRLEAPRILGELDALESDEQELALRRMTAGPGVTIRSSALSVSDCQAKEFEAILDSVTRDFRELRLAGQVRLVRSIDRPDGLAEETLRAQRVDLKLVSDSVLESARAQGSVDIEMSEPGFLRQLRAREQVDFEYREGIISRITARDECTLRSIGGTERNVVRAPELAVIFSEEGKVQETRAWDGVDLEVNEGNETRHTQSDELVLRYVAGLLSEAEQNGNFRLWQRASQNDLELESGRAVFDPLQRIIRSIGVPKARLRMGPGKGTEGEVETTANEFLLDRVRQAIQGQGKVESVMAGAQGPVIITAGEMKAEVESDWVSYTQSPRLVQDQNLVVADEIRVNRVAQSLVAEGKVQSTLVEASDEGKTYKVTARKLVLMTGTQQARYDGNVVLTSEELIVRAPRIELFFAEDESNQVDRVEASGGVEIVENGRTWQGERATYLRKEDRVVVRND